MEYQNLTNAIEVVAKLRDPKDGCPWDLKQTHESLLKYLIEESYEYIHAVETKRPALMEEELGDILLQVLLHSQVASERGDFTIDSVAKKLAEKMIHRHPHVFGQEQAAQTAEMAMQRWQELKSEKKAKQQYHIAVDDAYAPSLSAAYNIGVKSKEINFDWERLEQVIEKVDEELQEVKAEIYPQKNQEKIQEEIGDLLFATAQLARHLDIDPEEALKQANLKFIARIHKVEDEVKKMSKSMNDLSTEALEKIWQNIKKDNSLS